MPKAFDLQTQHYGRDGKTARETHYRMTIEEGRKLFERPPYSGRWFAEDGTLVRDDSAEINAVRAQQEADALKLKEEAAQAAREKLKEELRQEIEAEARAQHHAQKGKPHGGPSKN